ncbi:MAG: hypothetical protein V1853_03060 [bacterium]
MIKMLPRPKKPFGILTKIILSVLIVVAGYGIYQFFIVPQQIKLDAPIISYPNQSVFYRYSLNLDFLSAIFGGKTMTISQIKTEAEKDMKKIKSNGFDGVKINYHFKNNNTVADQFARLAAKEGLYPIGGLQGGEAKPRDRAFTPAEMTDWLNFVRGEVSTNKDIIYYWEIWGEPSLDAERYGTPEEFVQLLKATYPVIKKANPNAKVIVTLGAEAKDDTGFDDQVLALGGGDYFDDLSFHPYGANPYLQEDQVKTAIAHEQSLLEKYGNRWPLVISEIGQPASEVSETEQARLAAFLYAEAAKNNIPVTWLYWSDTHLLKDEKTGEGSNWGFIRYDGTERPMFEAIKPYLR